MTCSTMLDLMLDADLDALDEHSDSALSSHLRQCARCRAVARKLRDDTQSLADAVAVASSVPRDVRRERRTGRVWFAVAGMAAVLVVIVRGWPGGEARPTPVVAGVRVAATAPSLTPAQPAPAPPGVSQPPPRARVPRRRPAAVLVSRGGGSARVIPATATATTTLPVSIEALPPAERVTPVRLVAAALDSSLGSAVTADPPTGVRASVIRTSTPGVTVVWLYR